MALGEQFRSWYLDLTLVELSRTLALTVINQTELVALLLSLPVVLILAYPNWSRRISRVGVASLYLNSNICSTQSYLPVSNPSASTRIQSSSNCLWLTAFSCLLNLGSWIKGLLQLAPMQLLTQSSQLRSHVAKGVRPQGIGSILHQLDKQPSVSTHLEITHHWSMHGLSVLESYLSYQLISSSTTRILTTYTIDGTWLPGTHLAVSSIITY